MAKAQLFEALTLEDLQEKIDKYVQDKKVITASIAEVGGNNGVLVGMVITE